MKALRKSAFRGNDAVLVVGLGPVGLATLMLAKAMGAQKLIGVDVTHERCTHRAGKKTCRRRFRIRPGYA